MGKRCDEGKVKYSKHAEATKAIIRWVYGDWKRGGGGRTATRVYACPYCKHWHLTSQPVRARKVSKSKQRKRDYYAYLIRKRAVDTPIFHRLLREHRMKGHEWL